MSEQKDCNQKASHQNCANCGVREDNPICGIQDTLPLIEKAKTNVRYKAGQVIFYAGNDPIGLFTISSGLVKLEVFSPAGSAHTLRLVGPGGVLGYRSLFAGEPYYASAIAVEDCELCFLPKADLMNVFKNHPETMLRLLEHLSKDLRFAEEKWLGQMDKGAPERIAEALLFLQENFTHQQWTRKEIAQWAGTTPETVIRTLAAFEKEGLIDQKDGRSIRILSKEKLKERTL